MPSFSVADKEKVKGVVEEIERSMVRIKGEQEAISEACKDAKDKYGVEPKDLKYWAKILYNANLEEEKEKAEMLFESYELLFE